MLTAPTQLNIEPDKDQPTLLLVQQYDAVLELNTPSGLLSPPGPRYQNIVFVLPPGIRTVELSLTPRFIDNTEKQFTFETSVLEAGSCDHQIACCLEKAQRLWRQGDEVSLLKAIAELEFSLGVSNKPSQLTNMVWFTLGLFSYQQFEFEKARECYAQLSKQWWEDPARAATTSWALSAVALEQTHADLARAHLEASIECSHQAEKSGKNIVCDRLESQLYMGLVQMRLGDVESSMQLLHRSLDLAHRIGSNILVGKLNINIGGFYEFYNEDPKIDLVANHEIALEHYQRALDILAATGMIWDTVTAELNVGRLKALGGELQTTLQHYQNALSRNRLQHNRVLQAYIYLHLGRVYERLGDLDRSKYFIQRSYDSRNEAGAEYFKMSTGLLLGYLERKLGNHQAAIGLHETCLDFYSNARMLTSTAEASYELAEDYLLIDQPAAAFRLLNTLDLSFQDPFVLLKVLRAKSKALCLLGDQSEAMTELKNAVELSSGLPVLADHIQTLSDAAEICLEHNIEEAMQYANAATSSIESLRGDFEMSRLGTRFTAKMHDIFALVAIGHLHHDQSSQSKVDEAIRVLERGRAHEFRSHNLFNTQDEELSLVKKKLSILSEKRIANMSNAEPNTEIDDAYYEALERLGSLLPTQMETSESFNPGKIRIAKHQAVIYYISYRKTAYCIAIFSNTKHCVRLDSNTPLEKIVTEFTECLTSNHNERLTKLSSKIIPTELQARLSDIEAITIVPHGPLHRFPFSALVDSNEKPLFESKALSLAYSLESITRHQPDIEAPFELHAGQPSLDLAIFADPTFSQQSQAQMRNWSDSLEPLPWTAEEAKSIQSTFPDRPCKSFTGQDANRRNFLRTEVKTARVLHIASHGFYNPELSGIVGIALSAEDTDTGFIGLTDLMQEGFCNDLVVISGCETGEGELLQGEGTLSLARAFLVQGVKNVVSTLWPVADRTSAIFMRYFYEVLQETDNPVTALSHAQKRIRENPRYQAPTHWSGYQIHTRESLDANQVGDEKCN